MPRGHREALLAAAHALLRRQGLRATTARDLVAESGTNLASIGYHFGGKDALMAAALTAVCAEWTDRPVTAANEVADQGPGQALLASIRAMLAALPERREEILAFEEAVVVNGRGTMLGDALPTSTRRSLDAVGAAMSAAAPDLPAEVVAASAAVIIALHDGLAELSTIAPERVPEPEVVALVLAGFGAVLAPVLGLDPAALASATESTAEGRPPDHPG